MRLSTVWMYVHGNNCSVPVLLFLCTCLHVVREGLCPRLLTLLLNDVPSADLTLFAPCSMQVGDTWCLLQSLKDSPYFAAFSDRVQL